MPSTLQKFVCHAKTNQNALAVLSAIQAQAASKTPQHWKRLYNMALHFKVIADFSLSNGRPSLVGLSLHSTKAACTQWPLPGSLVAFASNMHIFPTLKEAHSYISYIMGRYPQCPVPFPVLDKGQNDLFSEVSK